MPVNDCTWGKRKGKGEEREMKREGEGEEEEEERREAPLAVIMKWSCRRLKLQGCRGRDEPQPPTDTEASRARLLH